MSGFTSGEGCFSIYLQKAVNKAEIAKLSFYITQHTRDEALLKSFVTFFGGGHYYADNNENIGCYRCSKFSDIYDKIIPFFKKYPIESIKSLDYTDWCKVADIIKANNHLTSSGLDQIKKLKDGMNRGRGNDDA